MNSIVRSINMALPTRLELSTIHVNRVLRQLRERNLMTFKEHRVALHDPAALKALAGYESPEDSPVVIRSRGNLSPCENERS